MQLTTLQCRNGEGGAEFEALERGEGRSSLPDAGDQHTECLSRGDERDGDNPRQAFRGPGDRRLLTHNVADFESAPPQIDERLPLNRMSPRRITTLPGELDFFRRSGTLRAGRQGANECEDSTRPRAGTGVSGATGNELGEDCVGGTPAGERCEKLGTGLYVRLALARKSFLLLQFECEGKLGGDRFRQLLRSGCLIFSGTRQKNAVQAVFSCDRSPEGAAQAHERSDHGMKLGIVNHLVNALTGDEQLPRQWRLERQVLPFLRDFISLRFPDQPAQARR